MKKRRKEGKEGIRRQRAKSKKAPAKGIGEGIEETARKENRRKKGKKEYGGQELRRHPRKG